MSNLSIKEVPDAWAEALRQRAARNHRSLQGELMAIIEQAVRDSLPGGNAAPMPVTARAGRGVAGRDGRERTAVRRGGKTIEQIAAEHRARFPQPITTGPLAVDLIRQDRDSR